MIEELDDLTLVYMYGAKNGRDSMKDEIERLRAAAEMALETLIGCCVSAGGVDDRKTILEAQDMLRAALEGEASDDAAT